MTSAILKVVSAILHIVCLQSVNAQVNVEDLVPVNVIPGTKLYTGIYYTLSANSFPRGCISWVKSSRTGIYHLMVDVDPERLSKYGKGNPYEIDNQWAILPSELPNHFLIKNRRKWLGFLTHTGQRLGSGEYAAILEQEELIRYLPGGDWRPSTMWNFIPHINREKCYRVKSLERKGYLACSHTMQGNRNYFLQVAREDEGEMEWFVFNPPAIHLTARIYDFNFENDIQDILNDESNEKWTLVSKQRFPNNSPATIKQTIEETVEMKESVRFSFNESFPMLYQTSIEVNNLVFKSGASMSFAFQGGFQASQAKTKESSKRTAMKMEIDIPPNTEVESSIYNVYVKNFVLPFNATMLITGTVERIVGNDLTQTQLGQIPGDVIEAYISATGNYSANTCKNNMRIIERTGDSILVSLTGEITGQLGIGTTVEQIAKLWNSSSSGTRQLG